MYVFKKKMKFQLSDNLQLHFYLLLLFKNISYYRLTGCYRLKYA